MVIVVFQTWRVPAVLAPGIVIKCRQLPPQQRPTSLAVYVLFLKTNMVRARHQSKFLRLDLRMRLVRIVFSSPHLLGLRLSTTVVEQSYQFLPFMAYPVQISLPTPGRRATLLPALQ